MKNQHLFIHLKKMVFTALGAFALCAASAGIAQAGVYRVEIRGLGDRPILAASLDTARRVAAIQTMAGIPHSYFHTEYTSIKVENGAGVVYPGCYRSLHGNAHYPGSIVNCPLQPGDFVSITHQEPYESVGRLRVYEALSGFQLPKAKTVRYQVAFNGALTLFSASNAYVTSTPFPAALAPVPAKTYRIDFLGLGNRLFMSANLDMTNRVASIQTSVGEPHVYFHDEYASIRVDSVSTGRVCHKSYNGRQYYYGETQICPFLTGDVVTVTHREPYESVGRLQAYDAASRYPLARGRVVRYQAGPDGNMYVISLIP